MNEFQTELIEQIKKFRLEHIEPFMEEDDQKEVFRKAIYQKIGELGLAGIAIQEEYGGAGLGYVDLCYALQELAMSSAPYAVTLSVSSMVQMIIQKNGTEEQKNRFLPELTSGQEIGAFCLSEAGSGSDASNLKTTAKKTEEGYILNGTKLWITSGGVASTYLVMARTGEEGSKGISAFIVKDGTPGLSFGKKEKKMGWRTSPTREVILQNCLIPHDHLLGAEGKGFSVAMAGLNGGRVTIAACALGLAKRALDEAIKYSLEREQFGHQLFNFQGLQFMMSDMSANFESCQILVHHAAQLQDQDKLSKKIASICKLKTTDMAMELTTDAVQILGGVGYTSEYPLERYMRDAKVFQIVEGTNQIQKIVIAKELKSEYQG